jgi:Leucine-rich repeat (LRR) protein
MSQLQSNKFESLPVDLGDKWPDLELIYAQGNQLTTLPSTLPKWTKLEELNISNNKFTELPECIGDLPKLKNFWANENQLAKLTGAICSWTNLRVLELNNCGLNELPEVCSFLLPFRFFLSHFVDEVIRLSLSLLRSC